MIIRFNPSGTDVHKNHLKIRLDLYPDEGCKTYNMHHILNVCNPMLCHFIAINEMTAIESLDGFLEHDLKSSDLKSLDDALILPDSIHLVSPFMRNRGVLSNSNIQTHDIQDLINSTNEKFAGFERSCNIGKSGKKLEPGTITIGAGATSRTSYWGNNVTYVSMAGTASGDGEIDTWELYFRANGASVEVATFYVVSGNNLSTRDTETIGDVASGSKQTFTAPTILGTTVLTGDYAGVSLPTGWIEADKTGGTGVWYASGDNIPCTNQAFSLLSNDDVSVYGTGSGGYSWTLEALTEAAKVYCEAHTGTNIDTRRDITDETEEDRTTIIAAMKAAYPGSDTYYKHSHHHYPGNFASCGMDEV